jgi:hypothetical protein
MGRRVNPADGIPSPSPVRSRPASASSSWTMSGPSGRVAPSVLQMRRLQRSPSSAVGRRRMEVVKRRKFDIILVDLYMSQTSGTGHPPNAALEFNRDTIVVVMTGNPTRDQQHRGVARRGLGLPAEAVLGHAPAGAHRPRVACHSHGRARDPPTSSSRHRHPGWPFSDKISLIGISPSVPQGGGPGPEGRGRRMPRCSSVRRERDRQGGHRPVHPSALAGAPSRTLVPINCAALPEPLLESEMFGHQARAPSPAPTATSPGCSRPPTAGPCSSTSSPRCRCRCRPSCCG